MIDLSSDNLLLSGGADGADYQWAKYANMRDHAIIHWTFDGHKSKCPEQHIVQLSTEQLMSADKFVRRANKSLKRKFPSKNDFVNNLLRRNYYQVQWASAVYAISSLDKDGLVDGGTGWATQMYMDRFLYDREEFENCCLYLYDQVDEKWLTWRGKWSYIDVPPTPHGIYAGIGTRKITSNAIEKIKELYNGQYQNVVSEPASDHSHPV